MIEGLFGSKSYYATFAIFFDYPHDPLHARLIARATGCDIKCVHRQLARLDRSGLIFPRRVGKEKWYRLRSDFPLRVPFEEFFRTTRNWRRYPGLESSYNPMGILEDLMDDGDG
jgi:hypothetical protein